MSFSDVLAGWPVSVCDRKVLRDSVLWNRSAHKFPGDTHLQGDGEYLNPSVKLTSPFLCYKRCGKEIRVHCFCVSFNSAHSNSHATSCTERALSNGNLKMINDMADGHCYSFA